MNARFFIALLLGSLALAVTFCPAHAQTPAPALTYPVAAKGDVVDDYFGVKVADPYRWMEDLDSPQTRAWVDAENKVTFGYLDTLPTRPALKARLTQLVNYERFGVPFQEGRRYFYTHNSGLQNQSVYFTQTALNAKARVLLDPNMLSKDGTVAVRSIGVTPDGKFLAYALSDAGSDWQTIHVRNVETGRDLPDIVPWSKFSAPSWTNDDRGFFYSAYDPPTAADQLKAANYNEKIYYHRLGTPASRDRLAYARPDHKDWFMSGGVTDDGRYLILDVSPGDDPKNGVFYQDLQDKRAKTVELLNWFDATYSFIANQGPLFWFQTNRNAPRGKIVAIDIRHPARKNWREIVPQSGDTLESVSAVGHRFLASYLHDAHTVIKVYGLDGKLERALPLPGIGTAGGFGGKLTDTETFFSYSSYAAPPTIYRYNVPQGRVTVFRKPQIAFNPSLYETKQVFCRSKDGTRVPIFLTYKKGIVLNGQNPTLLTGYGGFDISETPYFSAINVAWLEQGGVLADAVLRGGGEYGEQWHLAGTKARKQNVFDDFLAAAQWLIDNGYTSTPKLAITGGSNGGLLVGACLTQRPDLFGAALPDVGVMDMLRFQKFTVGWGWASDYGSSDNPQQFKALYAYSPLHNIHPGTHYPPTLITTSDHDDRVVPAHSFKFAATLQAAQGGDAPILIRIETRAGHGGGKPISKVIDEYADQYAFLIDALHMNPAGNFRVH